MPSARSHFEERAARLSDRAVLDSVEKEGAVTVRLRPNVSTAVEVVLYLYAEKYGTVALDDPACVPGCGGIDCLGVVARAVGGCQSSIDNE